MAKQLSMFDLNLDFVPEIARKDAMWQECISLALNSGGKDQRYGALVKHEGRFEVG